MLPQSTRAIQKLRLRFIESRFRNLPCSAHCTRHDELRLQERFQLAPEERSPTPTLCFLSAAVETVPLCLPGECTGQDHSKRRRNDKGKGWPQPSSINQISFMKDERHMRDSIFTIQGIAGPASNRSRIRCRPEIQARTRFVADSRPLRSVSMSYVRA